MFGFFLIVRLFSVWFVKTWYVPDEYWQSLEIAHKLVFGYGYTTWEWKKGIRSYLHPLFIAAHYKIFDYFNLDDPYLMNLMPRITQAILSAYADYCFYKWCGRTKWAMFSIATNWFWFYTASRTLINTVEMCLTTIALYRFPWKYSIRYAHGDTSFLWFAILICAIRPTAAIVWFPLCFYHFYLFSENVVSLLFNYIFKSLIILSVTTYIDSMLYGRLVFTPWEFFIFNFSGNIGAHYGVMNVYWYLTNGVPTVLGIYLIPFLLAVYELLKYGNHDRENQLMLLVTIIFTILVYSFLPHKEFRFILSIIPMGLYISSDYLGRFCLRKDRFTIWLISSTLLAASLTPIYFFGAVHQSGPLELMPKLNHLAKSRPRDSYFLFLMPCHSTPLYSHIHVNVKTRFLTCEPNFTNVPNYLDESDQFYQNPIEWINTNFGNDTKLPSHVITFNNLQIHFEKTTFSRYRIIDRFFHSYTPLGNVGEEIYLFQKPGF